MERKKQVRIHFCDFGTMTTARRKIIEILEKKYSVVLESANPQYLFYSVFGANHTKYHCVKIFYTGENIIPNFNICDYAIAFCHLDFGERYLRYPLYLFYEEDYKKALNKHKDISLNILKTKQRFCNFIVSNGYANPLRKKSFELLSQYKKVDSAGKFLNNIGGAIKDKFAFQSECKFSLCFENSSASGYVTEKLIQAAAAKTIPIYWGDTNAFGALNANGGGGKILKKAEILVVDLIKKLFCLLKMRRIFAIL